MNNGLPGGVCRVNFFPKINISLNRWISREFGGVDIGMQGGGIACTVEENNDSNKKELQGLERTGVLVKKFWFCHFHDRAGYLLKLSGSVW